MDIDIQWWFQVAEQWQKKKAVRSPLIVDKARSGFGYLGFHITLNSNCVAFFVCEINIIFELHHLCTQGALILMVLFCHDFKESLITKKIYVYLWRYTIHFKISFPKKHKSWSLILLSWSRNFILRDWHNELARVDWCHGYYLSD